MFFKTPISKTAKHRHLVTIALLFLFILIKAQTSFDINDPRNPQCPCHKYQKLADDEFKKLLRKGNKTNGEFVGKANSREDKIHKTRLEKYRKQKYKKHNKRIREPKWLYEFRHSGFLKRSKHLIKCPVWKK